MGAGNVTIFKLASVYSLRNGSFSVAVPDFARDPAIASFKRKGAIDLIARDPKTGKLAYRSESAERSGTAAEFDVATKYNELLLYARPRTDDSMRILPKVSNELK